MLTTTILFVGSCIVRAVDPDFFIDHIGLAVVISECGELSCDILNAIAGHIAVYHRKHVASAISTERQI